MGPIEAWDPRRLAANIQLELNKTDAEMKRGLNKTAGVIKGK